MKICPGGEIGRHVGLRSLFRKVCGFESRLGHQIRFFMNKSMEKYCWFIYFLIAIVISFYTQLSWTRFLYFLVGSVVNFCFFIYINYFLKNITSSNLYLRNFKFIAVVILLVLIFISGGLASFSGFHSSSCYNLVAKNIFTGKLKVHCNYPPWHTIII